MTTSTRTLQKAFSLIFFSFLAYFIIGPDGEITAHSGVEPMDLRDVALGLLEDEL